MLGAAAAVTADHYDHSNSVLLRGPRTNGTEPFLNNGQQNPSNPIMTNNQFQSDQIDDIGLADCLESSCKYRSKIF